MKHKIVRWSWDCQRFNTIHVHVHAMCGFPSASTRVLQVWGLEILETKSTALSAALMAWWTSRPCIVLPSNLQFASHVLLLQCFHQSVAICNLFNWRSNNNNLRRLSNSLQSFATLSVAQASSCEKKKLEISWNVMHQKSKKLRTLATW